MILWQWIMDGLLKVDIKISEVFVLEMLDVLCMFVCMVLQVLEFEGFICKCDGCGYMVLFFDLYELVQVYEVCGVFEGLVVGILVCEGIDEVFVIDFGQIIEDIDIVLVSDQDFV